MLNIAEDPGFHSRSSHQRCSTKKSVHRNFTKFTGKHLCQSLFFKKVAGLRPETLLKKRLWHGRFPVNFVEFLRTPFFKEHLWTTASENHITENIMEVVWKSLKGYTINELVSRNFRKQNSFLRYLVLIFAMLLWKNINTSVFQKGLLALG